MSTPPLDPFTAMVAAIGVICGSVDTAVFFFWIFIETTREWFFVMVGLTALAAGCRSYVKARQGQIIFQQANA